MFYKQLQLFDIVNLAASHCCTRNVDSHIIIKIFHSSSFEIWWREELKSGQ